MKKDELITISPEGDPEISLNTVNAKGTLDEYYDTKYGSDLIVGSQYNERETTSSYLERIRALYPSPEQKAYLEALIATAKPATYCLRAFQQYAEGSTPDPKVEAVFPRKLNLSIIGMGIKRSEADRWLLTMDPDTVNETIVALKYGAHTIDSFGNTLLSQARSELRGVILGNKLEGIKIGQGIKIGLEQIRVKAIQGLLGQELLEAAVNEQLKELVTHRALNLTTDLTATRMKEVAGLISTPFSPTILAANYVSLCISLDDVGIYPQTGLSIQKAFDSELRQSNPTTTPGEE